MPDSFMHHVNINGTNFEIRDKEAREEIKYLNGSLNDITEDTKNIANLNYLQIGIAWNGDSNANRATLYVPVKPSVAYTLSCDAISSFDAISWFEKADADSKSSLAGYSVLSSPLTKTTNASTNWIVLQFNKTSISEEDFATMHLQIEEGNSETEYSLPITAIDNNARSTADSAKANSNILFNSVYEGKNLFDPAEYIENKEYNSNGEIIDSNTVGIGGFIPVASGKTLFFSLASGSLPNYRLYYVIEFDSDKSFLRRVNVTTLQEYTPNYDAAFIRPELVPAILYGLKIEYDAKTEWSKYFTAANIANSGIMATVNMFGSIAGIGDSYTAGLSANSSGTSSDQREQSYIATLGKRAGIDWFNYGVSGATTKTYQTSSIGLPKVLSETPKDFYIFALGQNDVNVGTEEGSIRDIHDDWTLNADTFYGNYGKIISQIRQHAPNAKMVMVKSWLNTKKYGTEISYQKYDNAINAIANYYYIPCIAPFDDIFFNSNNYQKFRIQGHPTTMGYAMMGVAMERLISNCILQNPSYFLYSTVG